MSFGQLPGLGAGFPAVHDELFEAEAKGPPTFCGLRPHQQREYFAESFAYFIRHQDNDTKLEQMERLTPPDLRLFLPPGGQRLGNVRRADERSRKTPAQACGPWMPGPVF